MTILGLDIGTSSVKAALLHSSPPYSLIASSTIATNATHPTTPTLQSIPSILKSIESYVAKLPNLHEVERIGVCGQMHGVCLWSGPPTSPAWQSLASINLATSPLYTWMDARCEPTFLATLPAPDSHLALASGHGCATLFWLGRNGQLGEYSHSGSVMDLLTSLLTQTPPSISPQLAASWGYFNTVKREWNTEILSRAGFPIGLLPRIELGAWAGVLEHAWLGIRPGVPITTGLGDLQCSVLSVRLRAEEVFINVSTSAQIGHLSYGLELCSQGGSSSPTSTVGSTSKSGPL